MSIEHLIQGPAQRAWHYFSELARIPRPSGSEEQVTHWLRRIAIEHGWEFRTDPVGNAVIAIPGFGKLADQPPLILQGHMDMVCEKTSDLDHDFDQQGISCRTDGDWVVADRTTLGADNGVAIALSLAVAEEEMANRLPLELLFTVDEERGLTGARELDASLLNGRRLLNLDSEDDGVFIIGCAGGIDLRVTFPADRAVPLSDDVLLCRIQGLRGGHSGVNIHEGRGHAIQLSGVLLRAVREACPNLQLLQITGGTKKNAIPRSADLLLGGVTQGALSDCAKDLASELRMVEPDINISIEPGTPCGYALPAGAIEFLCSVSQGVISRDPAYTDLVQTSNSIGIAEYDDDGLRLIAHGRSSSEAAIGRLCEDVKALTERCGGTFSDNGRYPGWEPQAESGILRHGQAAFRQCFGTEPVVTAIHAGLEAGIIGAKLGTGELLSFGPTIENAHSPTERLSIESFERTFTLLKATVSTPGVSP